MDTWLRAECREVRNPGKQTGPTFISGFHVLPTREQAEKYRMRFKNRDNLHVLPVEVQGLRRKPRSICWLADKMFLANTTWGEL